MTASALNVVELRQYTLKAGQRDTLIELFEREFVGPQDAVGAHVLGTFRDEDDPDRFVWLRGFESMTARAAALGKFYGGQVWRAHRDAANATMIDSDNVLLLQPCATSIESTAFVPADAALVTADLHYLGGVNPQAFADFYERALRSRLRVLRAEPFVTLVSETAVNTFPRLPVRQGERVFVALTAWRSEDRERAFVREEAALGGWRDEAPATILPALMRKAERLRLRPVLPAAQTRR